MNDDWQDLDRRLASRLPEPTRTDVDGAWQRFRTRAAAQARHRPERRYRLPVALAAAAATVLIMLKLVAPPSPATEITTAPGERRTLRLPDGSSVVLAPGSRLRYSADAAAPRGAELRGQAWFEVVPSPDRPFRVTTGEHEVRVLGTAFGVEAPADGNSVTVAVSSGRVAFRRTGGIAIELTAGQAATASGAGAPQLLDSASAAGQRAWLDGFLRYDGAPLDTVVRDLERWFAVDIRLADPALGARRLTGVIGLDAPDRALETVAAALDLQLERTGSAVSLRSRPAVTR